MLTQQASNHFPCVKEHKHLPSFSPSIIKSSLKTQSRALPIGAHSQSLFRTQIAFPKIVQQFSFKNLGFLDVRYYFDIFCKHIVCLI